MVLPGVGWREGFRKLWFLAEFPHDANVTVFMDALPTCSIAQPSSQLSVPCFIDTFSMEKATVHGMAASITQLTLCQVSSEEIQTAAEVLEKASHKLKSVAEVLPQQITDLENTARQLRQLLRSLHSCTASASYEVSEAQKAILLLPRTEKGSSTSSEHYALLAAPTHYDELQEH